MSPKQAIAFARKLKKADEAPGLSFGFAHHKVAEALIALLDHGDKISTPDFETSVQMVAANIHAQGKFYIEIAVDPKTKEVGWTFEPTARDESQSN